MRRRPYTEIGIRRLKCVRCGEQAKEQWSACADGNVWRPICPACDVKLNAMALKFMRVPDWKAKMRRYTKRRLLPHAE